MKISSYSLVNSSQNLLDTEIRFHTASARAGGDDLIAFHINGDDESTAEKQRLFASKIIRALKKEGRIDFFADLRAFEGGSAEASYLKNKFPEIEKVVFDKNFFIVIKL